jgi:hypothetical protein
MKLFIQVFIFYSLLSNCQSTGKAPKHIFYLHGRIIELQGRNAVSDQFGKYEYDKIIDSLKNLGAIIHNEIRTEKTEFVNFCEGTSSQIDQLIKSGVNPKNITLIGASKGAVMAMNISNMNTNPINYVLLAANNSEIERENEWNLHGRILGIYEKSDSIAGKNYQYWIDKSTNAVEFNQVEINTGLGHGFLYRPINEWWNPTKEWMKKWNEN